MVKPIQLHIKRKTKVPTKRQIVHLYRSDWINVLKLSYSQVMSMFAIFERGGPFETEAQFCKWIYETLGVGDYLMIAFAKKRFGFYNFMKVKITHDGFTRLRKVESAEEKEHKVEVREQRDLKQKYQEAESELDKKDILDEIEGSEEIMALTRDIIKLKRSNKSGPSPYLKSIKPLYGFHDYDEFKGTSERMVDPQRMKAW